MLLLQNVPDETLTILINGITRVYTELHSLKKLYMNEWMPLFENLDKFVNDLLRRSDILINACIQSNASLKKVSIKLLSMAVSAYVNVEFKVVYSKLSQLPNSVETWPQARSKVFFFVCSLLYEYGR